MSILKIRRNQPLINAAKEEYLLRLEGTFGDIVFPKID